MKRKNFSKILGSEGVRIISLLALIVGGLYVLSLPGDNGGGGNNTPVFTLPPIFTNPNLVFELNNLRFNGSDHFYVGREAYPKLDEFNSELTIVVEGLNTTIGTRQALIARWYYNPVGVANRSFVMTVRDDGRVDFAVSSSGTGGKFLISNSSIPSGVPVDVRGVYDGANMSIYINNQLDATTQFTGSVFVPTQDVSVGAWDDGAGIFYPLTGSIKSLKVYKEAKPP